MDSKCKGKEKNGTQAEQSKTAKRSIAMFHKKLNENGYYSDVDPKVSVDASSITTIDTSTRDGSTLVVTKYGVIAVQESFEEASRIWANS